MFLPGIAAAVLLATPILANGVQGGGAISAISRVTITDEPAGQGIAIESRGPLPAPQVGVLDDPPRIYLDFSGVRTTTNGAVAASGGPVRRVRVALHQPDPPITRVVIDLVQPVSHRVDGRERGAGRVRVVLGRSSGEGEPRHASGAQSHLPDKAERDKAVALAALMRLERLRPVLSSIDSRADVPEDVLRSAIGEFDAIRQTLSVGKWTDPDEPSVSSHQSLAKVCELGGTAATARLDAQRRGDGSLAWNAASAAAGALILLDRATSDLRRSSPARKPLEEN